MFAFDRDVGGVTVRGEQVHGQVVAPHERLGERKIREDLPRGLVEGQVELLERGQQGFCVSTP